MLLFLCHYTKNVEASSLTPTFIIEPKGMAFAVIPFCWIVKFSDITRFLYQFLKISPKYCDRKEKDHNILWSKWYSRREYFGLRPRADCVGTNRRALRGWSSPIEIPKARPCLCKGRAFGTPGGNRTHNGPLGGGCYIHLTTEAFSGFSYANYKQAHMPLGNAIILQHSHKKSKEFCGRMPAKFPFLTIMRKSRRPYRGSSSLHCR